MESNPENQEGSNILTVVCFTDMTCDIYLMFVGTTVYSSSSKRTIEYTCTKSLGDKIIAILYTNRNHIDMIRLVTSYVHVLRTHT